MRADEPDFDQLLRACGMMASAMKLRCLEKEAAQNLFTHLLYELPLDGIKGRRAWAAFRKGLITERELRNLLMAHASTRISAFDMVDEPSYTLYGSEGLCAAFEKVLFGRRTKRHPIDPPDPWESLSTPNKED